MTATRSSHSHPKPPTMRDFLEDDAVALLRNVARTNAGMRERLSARLYLLDHGWTVEQVNTARDDEERL